MFDLDDLIDSEGIYINFVDESDCSHERRIMFELTNCIAYECPACGNVIREMRKVD